MNNGQIVVNAKDIKIYHSDIYTRNIWSKENVGGVKLNAVNNIQLNDSDITVTSITAGNRGDIHLSGERFDSINSQIAIIDERKGISGSVNLDFNESIKMVDSQVVSIGQSKLTRDTNGNDINIKSGELLIKNSLISGFVEGNGERGVTSLDISGDISLTGSFIGGLLDPLEVVKFDELITDGTLGDVKNLGQGREVVIPSELGDIHGENLYHSIDAINLVSGSNCCFGSSRTSY